MKSATQRVRDRVKAREAVDDDLDPMAQADLEHADAQAHTASLVDDDLAAADAADDEMPPVVDS